MERNIKYLLRVAYIVMDHFLPIIDQDRTFSLLLVSR